MTRGEWALLISVVAADFVLKNSLGATSDFLIYFNLFRFISIYFKIFRFISKSFDLFPKAESAENGVTGRENIM